MSLVAEGATSPTKPKARRKTKSKREGVTEKPKAIISGSEFRWGAKAIAAEVGLEPQPFYHLFYAGLFGDAVASVPGGLVAHVPKLKAKMLDIMADASKPKSSDNGGE